jgi:peptide/nickel transport system ATP-binding protein
VPEADPERTRHKVQIALRSEEIPKLTDIPPGCAFHPRCTFYEPGICNTEIPVLQQPDEKGQWVACTPLTQAGKLVTYVEPPTAVSTLAEKRHKANG